MIIVSFQLLPMLLVERTYSEIGSEVNMASSLFTLGSTHYCFNLFLIDALFLASRGFALLISFINNIKII